MLSFHARQWMSFIIVPDRMILVPVFTDAQRRRDDIHHLDDDHRISPVTARHTRTRTQERWDKLKEYLFV